MRFDFSDSLKRPSIVSFMQWAKFVYRRFDELEMMQVAGSLTFTTVFALVPMLAVMLSVASVFPIFETWSEQFMNFISQMIVPSGVGEIQSYLDDFKSQIGKLSVFGVAWTFVTAIVLLHTLEDICNKIWAVQERRSLWLRIPMYFMLLTLGPIVAGFGLTLSAYVRSMGQIDALVGNAQRLLPIFYDTFFLSLAYRIVPNCKVAAKQALGGAFLTALALEAAKWGFGVYLTNSHSYSVVYGAFAVVPIFLLWLHVLWIVILVGALLTACAAYWNKKIINHATHDVISWADTMRVLSELARARQIGQGQNIEFFRQRIHRADNILNILESWNYIVKTNEGDCVLLPETDAILLSEIFVKTVGDDAILRERLNLDGLTLRDYVENPLQSPFF